MTSPEIAKYKERRALVEAALYVAGRPLDLDALASIAKTRSRRVVREVARDLKHDYDSRDTSLELLELNDGRFVIQLKPVYSPQVRRLAMRPLLTPGPLKTLSYISYRQPVSQKQVITVRGHHVYGHLKQLEHLGLITRERVGRTRIVRTTSTFADYFGLSHDLRAMKRQLKKVFALTPPTPAHEREGQQ
jgi:segregation and condensation protein B